MPGTLPATTPSHRDARPQSRVAVPDKQACDSPPPARLSDRVRSPCLHPRSRTSRHVVQALSVVPRCFRRSHLRARPRQPAHDEPGAARRLAPRAAVRVGRHARRAAATRADRAVPEFAGSYRRTRAHRAALGRRRVSRVARCQAMARPLAGQRARGFDGSRCRCRCRGRGRSRSRSRDRPAGRRHRTRAVLARRRDVGPESEDTAVLSVVLSTVHQPECRLEPEPSIPAALRDVRAAVRGRRRVDGTVLAPAEPRVATAGADARDEPRDGRAARRDGRDHGRLELSEQRNLERPRLLKPDTVFPPPQLAGALNDEPVGKLVISHLLFGTADASCPSEPLTQ
ncbi:hypothetical protein EMIT0111MI5_10415 [Burkholderia sp. IT-111MI5]